MIRFVQHIFESFRLQIMISIQLIAVFYSLSLSGQSCLPDGITFLNQEQVNDFKIEYGDCKIIEGGIIIRNTTIHNLDSLNNITTIKGGLQLNANAELALGGLKNLTTIQGGCIVENNGLASFQGLTKLKSISGDFSITNNQNLQNLEGLESLLEIKGSFFITDNAIQNLDPLSSLTSIDGSLFITKNDVTNIEGLLSLTKINGLLSISDNDQLMSLEGLDQIEPKSIIKLFVTQSEVLSLCSVKSICEYLNQNLGPVTIDMNSTGCNTEMEIKDICISTSSNDINSLNLQIYPNPADQELYLLHDGVDVQNVTILDYAGRQILQVAENASSIDVSNLKPGIYILALLSSGKILHKRFVKS